MTRIFFVAGESSGDIHGANLIRALKEQAPAVDCAGLGGKHMASAGMALRFDLAGEAIMGFTEVVRKFPQIRRLFHETLAYLKTSPPDCLVLIDYPGFNLRLAREAKRLGIPIVYYISPQVWAWKKKRIFTIAKLVRKMLVILPFEESLYRTLGLDCTFVGHPLLDHIARTPIEGQFKEGLVIGLMPGSREQEISRLMPLMTAVAQGIAQTHPEARFVTPCVDPAREAQVRALAGDLPLETVIGNTYELLDGARFCLVASGTATVETALFQVPMIILYQISPVSYSLARLLVDVEHIGMVNILAGKRIVPEYVQRVPVDEVVTKSLELIEDTPARAKMLTDLAAVKESLGGPGASRRAATEVLQVAQGAAHG